MTLKLSVVHSGETAAQLGLYATCLSCIYYLLTRDITIIANVSLHDFYVSEAWTTQTTQVLEQSMETVKGLLLVLVSGTVTVGDSSGTENFAFLQGLRLG